MPTSAPSLRCRQIAESDIPAVAALLARGFHHRNQQFWLRALAQLTRREPPPGLPKYGYLLESGVVAVGALLLICSMVRTDGTAIPRCNLSSWYVEPTFRTYAALLVSQALRHKNVTYLNVSPAPHTLPIIEAQGFARYCDGVFIAVPMLNGLFGHDGAKVIGAEGQPDVAFDPLEQKLLQQHAALGCISLWCTHAQSAYPFVFRTRLVKSAIPCAQLIYCRDIADFVRFAGPIGRFLALRGRPIVIVDANGPIDGLAGVFFRGTAPKYFRGPLRPRLGDLAYTEYALLGV